MPTESSRSVDGECPECGGDATIFPDVGEDDTGHIYCDDHDDCGAIFRDFPGVSRFIDE